jgi:hypothetical protein
MKRDDDDLPAFRFQSEIIHQSLRDSFPVKGKQEG